MLGGKVIGSGGFGCIFEPSLQCEGEIPDNQNQKLSKLMVSKYATDEFNQIQKYQSILRVVPNYADYFLLNDFKLCKPSKLTKLDLQGYGKKCKALKKKGITTSNINKSLDQLLAMNMPNGGIDVEKFVEHHFVNEFTISNMIALNNSLINLLKNGIGPMNKLNVYHCDIKDANVLIKMEDNKVKTRLIDWGLSVIFDKTKSPIGIPKKLYRRPFQFNVPFSSILFNKDFTLLYNNFLGLHNNPDYFQIREFIINYIFIWNDIRGSGHLSSINDMIKKLTIRDLTAIKTEKIKEHFIEYQFTYYYIVEYLSKIVEKYTRNGKLELMVYFEDVFLKNIDVWGFTMIYIIFYEKLYKSFNELNEYQMEFITKLKYIIIHYLYESPITPINVSSLVNELTNLNEIIKKCNTNKPSAKLAYFIALKDTIGGLPKTKTNKRTYKNKSKRAYTFKKGIANKGNL